MTTVYTLQPYEKGLMSDGFYKLNSIKEAFEIMDRFSELAKYPVTFILREHEIENDSGVCSISSIKKEIVLNWTETRK